MSTKTWRDLDVSAVRRLLAAEVGALSDARFAAIMDQVAADLDVRLPYRTCGVSVPVNAPDHVCRSEDRWLWRWVQGHASNADATTGFRRMQEALQRRYPSSPAIPASIGVSVFPRMPHFGPLWTR